MYLCGHSGWNSPVWPNVRSDLEIKEATAVGAVLLRSPVDAQLSIAPLATDSGNEPWVAELRAVERTNLMFLSCVPFSLTIPHLACIWPKHPVSRWLRMALAGRACARCCCKGTLCTTLAISSVPSPT